MADRFVSIPRVFDSGNFEEWLERYEICAAANGWKEKALIQLAYLLITSIITVTQQHKKNTPIMQIDIRQQPI